MLLSRRKHSPASICRSASYPLCKYCIFTWISVYLSNESLQSGSVQKPFDAQEILAVGWRLRPKSFLLEDVYSVVWITACCIGQTALRALSRYSHCGWLSSRCSLLEHLSAAKRAPLLTCLQRLQKTRALCMAGKMRVHIITNPQVFCKRENKWGERSQHIWSLFNPGSFCGLIFSFCVSVFHLHSDISSHISLHGCLDVRSTGHFPARKDSQKRLYLVWMVRMPLIECAPFS